MRHLISMLMILAALNAGAQQTLSGSIADQKGEAVMNANIYFEGSYEGTISDAAGHFVLKTDLTGDQLLTISCMGYETYSRLLFLDGTDTVLAVVLQELISELDEVSITAGVFSASDKKKSATLNSFDVATTASAMGDVYGAYATMPGSQKVGEEGMLFVRGGDSYETKTFMDGMLVQSPFFSKMPDIPTRGRYSPLLFSETIFSTGGYSAEYGQALSSVVDLTTNGLETEDKTSVSIMTVGASASAGRRWKNSSLAFSGLYANNALHHKLFKQNVDWVSDPVMADGTLMYRAKAGETGLFKAFCSYNFNAMEMNYDNFEEGTLDRIAMRNHTMYTNASFSGELSDKWLIKTGLAYNKDLEEIVYRGDPVHTTVSASQVKLVLTYLATDKVKIRMGADVLEKQYTRAITLDSIFSQGLSDLQPSLFLESEITLSKKLALRLGARAEYTSLLEKTGISPRLAAAYKTGSHSQVSLAWGKYHQTPKAELMLMAPGLNAERADHYILNFQYRNNRRLFRAEAYLKQYDQLVKYLDPYDPDPRNYSNKGSGYAGGLDVFWRDQASVEGLDYWVSYSYLDTRRDYQDFPRKAMPSYASAHNLSLVFKYLFTRLSTFAGLTYSYASPRPFNDPNHAEFMDGRTRSYNDISMNITHVTRLFGNDFIIHMNITNLFGFDNVFGYTYSNTPGEDGIYASRAIVPTVGTQAVLLFMLSF
jgi:vitamin B12 transporter